MRTDSVAGQGSAGSRGITGYDDDVPDFGSVGADITQRLGKILRTNIAASAANCQRLDTPGTAPGG